MKYKIEDTYKEEDGSLIVLIRKQYNTYQTGDYME